MGDAGGNAEFARARAELADAQMAHANDLYRAKKFAEAEAACRDILHRDPSQGGAWERLAHIATSTERPLEAIAFYEEAIRHLPHPAEAHNNLAVALHQRGELEVALHHYRRAVTLELRHGLLHSNLGSLLRDLGHLQDGVIELRRALELDPRLAHAHSNLGVVLCLQARADLALPHLRLATALKPDWELAWSNLLFCLNYVDNVSPVAVAASHRLFGRKFDQPPQQRERFFSLSSSASTDPDPERRLRVGLVSPDLKQHSVAFFLEPLLAAHDRQRVAYFAYANLVAPDAVTERLQGHVEHWRSIHDVSDETAARLIHADRIDILIDLAGHTANNRLALLARRPAPVQMTYLGYANTTGLPAVDWRLTDAWADPPGTTEALHTEELLRIPSGFLCYRPREHCPAPGPPQVATTGRVTFGSFNLLAKVSPTVLALWARILDRVPGSRLILKGPAFADPATKAAFAARLAQTPLSAHDVALLPHIKDEGEHLAAYQGIDIALDTWPYHGTTTTCEALWMGVPVVTLAGRPHASRVGVSLLTRIGLPELVAATPDEYVSIAAGLAADRPRLAALRGGLRERVIASGLTDAAAGARAFEGTLREAWRTWCRRERARATPPAAGTTLLPMTGDVLVAVSDTLEQITPYVLLEQGDWFEAEAKFVRQAVCRGERVVDIGANHGVYALPLANRVGQSGRAWVFEPEPTVAARLRQSLVANGLDNVTLVEAALSNRVGESKLTTDSNSELAALDTGGGGAPHSGPVVTVTTLDASAARLDIRDVAFVKMDAEGAEPAIFEGGRRFFSQESPLVMFEVRHGANIHRPTLEAVVRLGYDVYRLFPGPNLLAPWPEQTALDPYQLNLFACKGDRAAALEERGLLARTIADVADPPVNVWITHLRPLPIAQAMGAGWRSANDHHERGYFSALDHHALAHRPLEPAAVRMGHLAKAVERASAALGERILIPTLQTVARLAWEAGYRAIAVETLNLLIQRCQLQGAGGDLLEDLPFLPVSPRFDQVALIDGDLRRWVLAGALEQRERLRAFSSYYTAHDPDTLTSLQTIADLGYQSPEMARRLEMVRRRRGPDRRLTTCFNYPDS